MSNPEEGIPEMQMLEPHVGEHAQQHKTQEQQHGNKQPAENDQQSAVKDPNAPPVRRAERRGSEKLIHAHFLLQALISAPDESAPNERSSYQKNNEYCVSPQTLCWCKIKDGIVE